ncbi:MAG: transcriptional regulator MraZ [Solirubrobacteraceae bacterium]|nr:transcriptional regulator MraZ [Solirubrobacteraceae bacterium]
MAFRGTFDYSLDQKNRLTVPAKFRAALSEGVLLSMGTQGCVEVWRPADFDGRLEAALEALNPLSKEATKLREFFNANSHDVELDSAGRVAMPASLQTHAKLDKEVVVTGVGDHLQVWDRTAWAAYNGRLAGEIDQIIEGLGHPA